MGSFNTMDKAKHREIASRGGKSGHARGTAHEWDVAEAREAGRKGGERVSQDKRHMAQIGRMGGCKHQRVLETVEINDRPHVRCAHCGRVLYAVIKFD